MDTSIVLASNNGYGALELKQSYQSFTLKGFIIAISLHILAIVIYLFISYINNVQAKEIPYNPHELPIIVYVDVPGQDKADALPR